MSVPLYTVDAFTRLPFTGNPAAVCLLDDQPPESWMGDLAAEMNLSETAFAWPDEAIDADRRLRWFTPTSEVDLCGHATLATAHVLFERGDVDEEAGVVFDTNGGQLSCRREDGWIRMAFPAHPPEQRPGAAKRVAEALGVEPAWVGETGLDLFVLLEDERTVRAVEPDLDAVEALDGRGVIVTAGSEDGSHVDFVSRFFAPAAGVPEDPVTGSAHCALGPYWADELGEDTVVGRQVSTRGGTVRVSVEADGVELSGHARTVLEASLADAATPPS